MRGATFFSITYLLINLFMKTVINPQTGNPEVQFEAKLLSISPTTFQLNNEKQTPYRVASVEFVNNQGEVKVSSAIVYEANFTYGMKPGITYLCRAIRTTGQSTPLVTMSHLVATERASFDDFNFDVVEAPVKVAVEAEDDNF